MSQKTMPQNEATPKGGVTHNGFPMSYAVATTQRYGDIDPFFYIHTVGGDKIPLQSSHELRSFTLKSPLLSGLKMNKDYYEVPMRAILPNTWDLIFANPTQGDDVPAGDDSAYTYYDFKSFLSALVGWTISSDTFTNLSTVSTNPQSLYWFKSLILLNKFFSNGELLSKFGLRLSDCIRVYVDNKFVSWDIFYDDFLSSMSAYNWKVVFSQTESYVYNGATNIYEIPEEGGQQFVSFRRFLEILSEDCGYTELYTFTTFGSPDYSTFFAEHLDRYFTSEVIFSLSDAMAFDYSPLAAYQLICAHYFTNDHVDFVYSANLYRNLMYSYASVIGSSATGSRFPTFRYNGSSIIYDAFSCKLVYDVCSNLSFSSNLGTHNSAIVGLFAYLYGLFTTRKSLRFGDYFTGARPQPLAVGDVNVRVQDNAVSAIDITRNIMKQRFLNSVNRARRKFSDYMKAMTAGHALPVSTDPKWLASETYNIGGMEIENTTSERIDGVNQQGRVVTNLRSQQSNYFYEYRDAEPSIVIGLCSFEAPRIYSKSNDRHFFRQDRFDMFQKDFQYIGDQDIYGIEVSATRSNSTFAYTLRNMEDKQRVSIATGGFVEALPSWAFVCDNEDSENNVLANISPEYIRSTNAEFDRFYSDLMRMDSAGYFHFIIFHYNTCNPVRPMAFAPSIL